MKGRHVTILIQSAAENNRKESARALSADRDYLG